MIDFVGVMDLVLGSIFVIVFLILGLVYMFFFVFWGVGFILGGKVRGRNVLVVKCSSC